jgi:hypothetical protein
MSDQLRVLSQVRRTNETRLTVNDDMFWKWIDRIATVPAMECTDHSAWMHDGEMAPPSQ